MTIELIESHGHRHSDSSHSVTGSTCGLIRSVNRLRECCGQPRWRGFVWGRVQPANRRCCTARVPSRSCVRRCLRAPGTVIISLRINVLFLQPFASCSWDQVSRTPSGCAALGLQMLLLSKSHHSLRFEGLSFTLSLLVIEEDAHVDM